MMMNLILCRGIPARVNKGWQGVRNQPDASLKGVFWETRAFAMCAPRNQNACQETKWNQSETSGFRLTQATETALGKNDWRYCHQRPGAQRLTFTVPSSHGQRDDLMNHTYQGARRCPNGFLFFVCLSLCVSVWETLTRFTWYQCWLKPCFLKALSFDVAELRCMSV